MKYISTDLTLYGEISICVVFSGRSDFDGKTE